MSETGRITIPASIRRELRIEGERDFEISIDDVAGTLRLTPMLFIPASDAWFYTAEHLERLEAALEDGRSGRVLQLNEEKLNELLPEA